MRGDILKAVSYSSLGAEVGQCGGTAAAGGAVDRIVLFLSLFLRLITGKQMGTEGAGGRCVRTASTRKE